jgi:hypothetical protein
MKLKNFVLALRDQGPPLRFLRNLYKGHLWGLWHKNSHISQGSGKPKVMYNTKATAVKSAAQMTKKHGTWFSNYKCVWCDGYHIGKNRDNKNNWDQNDPTVK